MEVLKDNHRKPWLESQVDGPGCGPMFEAPGRRPQLWPQSEALFRGWRPWEEDLFEDPV